ncbi:MAG: biotin transporter BioY, partial [Candidatus Helarchaeota archaeon]|nr:biotin transporter BioY [Candidatus Helarchaeota archaeon]
MNTTERAEKKSEMEILLTRVFYISVFTFLTAASAFVKIPMYPVPITLQTLFVLLAANILGKKDGTISLLLYLMVGLSGIPIFANGGGPSYIFQPSFGYLIGFIPAVYFTGIMVEKINYNNYKETFILLLTSNLIGLAIIYIFGLSYLYVCINFLLKNSITIHQVIFSGFIIFIPGMIIKLLT